MCCPPVRRSAEENASRRAHNLRAGAYQLLYMDKIPSSAAVNEAVTLTRTLRQPYAAGLTNAVLRAVQRRQAELLSALPEDAAGLAVRYSCPEALIACWQRDYGAERTLSLLREINAVPPNTLRINTLQVTADHFLRRLEAEGIRYTRHPLLPECVEIADAAAIKGTLNLCRKTGIIIRMRLRSSAVRRWIRTRVNGSQMSVRRPAARALPRHSAWKTAVRCFPLIYIPGNAGRWSSGRRLSA